MASRIQSGGIGVVRSLSSRTRCKTTKRMFGTLSQPYLRATGARAVCLNQLTTLCNVHNRIGSGTNGSFSHSFLQSYCYSSAGSDRMAGNQESDLEVITTKFPDKATAIVRLNRPKSLNALCSSLNSLLIATLQDLDNDSTVRAIVITGNEKAFAAGADIKEMSEKSFADVQSENFTSNFDAFFTFRKPIIAAVNGHALGGGCELAMLCDIIIAGEKASFGQPEIKLGTIPGMGGTQRLIRAIGKSKAMEIILTGGSLNAQDAFQAGLVSRVVEPAKLEEEAMKVAEKIASYSQPAVAAAKECVNRAYESTLKEGVLFERRAFHATFANKDRKEGMDAFAAKRPAIWSHH